MCTCTNHKYYIVRWNQTTNKCWTMPTTGTVPTNQYFFLWCWNQWNGWMQCKYNLAFSKIAGGSRMCACVFVSVCDDTQRRIDFLPTTNVYQNQQNHIFHHSTRKNTESQAFRLFNNLFQWLRFNLPPMNRCRFFLVGAVKLDSYIIGRKQRIIAKVQKHCFRL